MSKRLKMTIGILIFAAAALGAVTYSFLSDRVPLNDSSAIGNTPGNVYNGGYFCELDGTVFFSNVDDSHTLYSMKPDETGIRRLGSMGVSQIVGAGRFVYMYMDASQYSTGKGLGYMGNSYGIFRYNTKNNKNISLDRVRPQMMQLCGSYIYYCGSAEDGTGTYKIRIDKKDRKKLTEGLLQPAGFDGRYLYYSGVNGNPSLYYMNTSTGDTESKVMDGNISCPIPSGDFIYYIDNAKNYHICRLNRTTGATELIGTERVDCYNTNGRYIWFATSAEGTPALKRMDMNGGNVTVIVEGVYNSINLTSRYLYFAPFDKAGVTAIMHVPLEATGPVSRFVVAETK
ncbi:MAG: DUF5050 domain-containing protein [Lachnospiraceae bacterium]|nr:DUF5050 domain-containing protein [Lachnospiraceae bacterium]